MPRNRATLAFSITVVGPLLATLAWLWTDASGAGPSALASLQAQFGETAVRAKRPFPLQSPFVSQLMGRPLFQSAQAGTSAVEPSLRLEGLAKTSRRTAALIAIGDQAPQWLEAGQTRSGVTLKSIAADSVAVATIGGLHPLKLGKAAAPVAANPVPQVGPPRSAPMPLSR